MGLKSIRLLVTAAGCPGASTLIRYLKSIEEREVKVFGVDSDNEAIGRFLADGFSTVPQATADDYIDELLNYAISEDIDCILVASSYEVEVIAKDISRFESSGIKVLISSAESLRVANNKKNLYELFENNDAVKVPKFKVVRTLNEFVECTKQMGYPENNLCFKPPYSKGSRGFRYLSSKISRADLLINHKPESTVISVDEMVDIFQNESDFPELLLMEAVEGEEIDSMVLAHEGDPLLITHKTREKQRGGVITHGGHCARPELSESINEILSKIPLSYNFGIQFKGGYLMEINPRLSSFIYDIDWVEPYFSVKLALGEYSNSDIKALQTSVPMDLRMVRYFDQFFFRN